MGGSAGAPRNSPDPVVSALQSSGHGLDRETLDFMQSRFRHDFSAVRVHTDATAAQAAKSLHAKAWTLGREVVFAAGAYSPRTSVGRSLLAHELAHVVQNRNGMQAIQFSKAISHPDDASEREAVRVSAQVTQGHTVGVHESPSAPVQAELDGPAKGLLIAGGVLGAIGIGVGVGLLLSGGKKDAPDGPSLDDPNFRKKWESGLEKGLARLTSENPKGCEFSTEGSFDSDNWVEIPRSGTRPEARSYKPKQGSPYQAVETLDKFLDRWNCDCRLFGELAQLFAWHEALKDDQAAFNKRFAGLILNSEGTTGLPRETIGSKDGLDEVDDAAWRRAPGGTKVVWQNTGGYARAPWRFEHAIKRPKSDPKGPDRYAAQGVGLDVSEEQVKETMASKSLFDFPLSWTITSKTIEGFKKEGLPESKLKKLQSIQGKPVKVFTEFVKQPVLVELNGGPLNVPYYDQELSVLSRFGRSLLEFAEHSNSPGDPDAARYIRDNIFRNKLEIPK